MGGPKYTDALNEYMLRIGELHKRRTEIDAELGKLRNLARATINMLPDHQQTAYTELLDSFYQDTDIGLKEAITNVLMASEFWMSAVAVRDALFQNGFNFDSYTSNPLASIHTVLKRFPTEKVETRTKDGVTVYRWKMRVSTVNTPARLADLVRGFVEAEQAIPPPKTSRTKLRKAFGSGPVTEDD